VKSKRTFKDFIQETGINPRPKGGRRCTICDLKPEIKKEVESLRAQSDPVSYGVIAIYLKEYHGIFLTDGGVRNHFDSGHGK